MAAQAKAVVTCARPSWREDGRPSKESYRAALDELERLPFEARCVALEQQRSALTALVQAAFGAFHRELLEAVIHHNRSSCALKNFADEHMP